MIVHHDDVKISKNQIEYFAIPFPIPKMYQDRLIKAGRIRGEAPAGDIDEIYRVERELKKLYGVRVRRELILPISG
jgi:hypothetical protein